MDKNLLVVYENCIKSRYLDWKLHQLWQNHIKPRSIFSGRGAELGPSIVSLLLEKEDYLIPYYRGFAQFLGKKIDPVKITAELFGKKNGASKGIGDSSSFRDPSCGIPGYTINLGAMFPVSIGIAFAVKFKNEKRIVAHCFGDGEASRTTFSSALNLASLWDLPILYVCFNNGVSISSEFKEMSSTNTISERAKGYGMEGETLYENDPLLLYKKTNQIINEIRRTKRPFLLEIVQKKFAPHSTVYAEHPENPEPIPTNEDTILILKSVLVKNGADQKTLDDIENKSTYIIDKAIEIALRDEPISNDEFFSIYYE